MSTELGISRIVNMAAGSLMTSQELYGESITILLITAEDMESYDLSQHFDEVTDFIDKGKEEGAGVFVHCMAGVSRSVTVSVAFLMKYCGMSLSDAARQVRSHRLQAYPNVRFIKSLLQLEKQLKQKKK
ncbi:PREDICTED: dual specificity protein phosphatase 1B-like isoform X2 [Amphimedon queenslandica]|uniref:protein-tyrosine-phosphatase n=1 Tax=Amphimedon queenslandica TaxID=400682 RepID=A0AAN0IQU1_AMPQE|nr:PREDICTED: dual specificity protein phosphatase 1B-like isoform X2 [Amphimedon queenslandica]|eukprot:XP_011406952.2 PREDICTED: dual specificity protein phosphatase 1B-like isoform X2 [Amphimedon queenslandica]